VLRYLIRRGLHSLVVLVGVSLLVFILMRLTGDPVFLLLPPDASQEQVDRLRENLGLDEPIPVQYGRFLVNALQGDFGTSYRTGQPAMEMVLDRVPATLALASVAAAITIIIAVPVGIVSAKYRHTWVDDVGRGIALLGQAVPSFWLGIMLILIFSVRLGWLPPFGTGSWKHLILPGITLGAYSAAIISRLLRSTLLEVLNADYIRTARAKGLSDQSVLYRHALQNAALPVVTMFGLQVGVLFGGAVITEFVFAYPGMGRLVLQAIGNRDFAVVQAFVLLVTVIIIAANVMVDLLYAVLDPRIKVQ
jgi:peptide/nickel transport system permease protein